MNLTKVLYSADGRILWQGRFMAGTILISLVLTCYKSARWWVILRRKKIKSLQPSTLGNSAEHLAKVVKGISKWKSQPHLIKGDLGGGGVNDWNQHIFWLCGLRAHWMSYAKLFSRLIYTPALNQQVSWTFLQASFGALAVAAAVDAALPPPTPFFFLFLPFDERPRAQMHDSEAKGLGKQQRGGVWQTDRHHMFYSTHTVFPQERQQPLRSEGRTVNRSSFLPHPHVIFLSSSPSKSKFIRQNWIHCCILQVEQAFIFGECFVLARQLIIKGSSLCWER